MGEPHLPSGSKMDGILFPTNKWVVFGHHFSAIAGPGPLVGPILAAQFGYLPGTLWIIIGGVLGGAVQDFVVVVQLGAPGRQVARANGQGRNQRSRRLCGAVWRALDLDHCDCGDRACGRECVEGESLGILYHRDDGADRSVDGNLHALPSGRGAPSKRRSSGSSW